MNVNQNPYSIAAPRIKPYNPNAYVPGGASSTVARAIQNRGYATAPTPTPPPPISYPPPGGGPPVSMPGGGYPGTSPIADNAGLGPGQVLPDPVFRNPDGSGGTILPGGPAAGTSPQRNPAGSVNFSLLDADPLVVNARMNLLTQGQNINNMLRTQLGQGIISLGDPNLVNQLSNAMNSMGYQGIIKTGNPWTGAYPGFDGVTTNFALDPSVAQAAQQATDSGLSTMGQLNFQQGQDTQQLLNSLAGNGMIFSGEPGYQLTPYNTQTGQGGKLATQFAQQRFSADQGALQNFTGMISNALMQQQNLSNALRSAYEYAYNYDLNNPAYFNFQQGAGNGTP